MRLLLCLLAISMSLSATTFYVSNSGSDSNNGTSTSTPWQTVAHVNAQTFQPGDSVLFQRGGLWREYLQPGQSGTSASPITFGAYGSGALPIISAADILSSWTTINTPTDLALFPNTISNSYWIKSGITSVLEGQTDPNGTTTAEGLIGDTSGTHNYIRSTNISISPNSSYDYTVYAKPGNQNYLFFQLQYWNGGSWIGSYGAWCNVSNGTVSNISGGATATATAAGNGFYKCKITVPSPSNATGVQLLGQVASSAGGFGFTGDGTTVNMYVWESSLKATASPDSSSVYRSSWTSTPNSVFYNGAPLTSAASVAALLTGQYYYDGSTYLYIYDDPASATVEAANRAAAIGVFGRNYLTFDSLQLEKNNTSFYGAIQIDGQSVESTGVTVQNCTIAYSTAGIGIYSANNVTVNRCTIYGNAAISISGISPNQGSTSYNACANLTVTGNTIHDVQIAVNTPIDKTSNIATGLFSGNTIYNIQNNGMNLNNSSNLTVSNNVVHDGGLSVDDTAGIHMSGSSNGVISGNTVYNWNDPGTHINGSGILLDYTSAGGSTNTTVAYNSVYNNATAGIVITDAPNSHVYQNTLYNNGRDAANTSGAGIWIGGPAKTSSGDIKNNIVLAAAVDANSRLIYFATPTEFSGFTFSHNDWYFTSGSNWYFNGGSVGSSIATWDAQGSVASDLNTDPTLNSVGSLDFSLKSTSPARNAGIPISGFTFPYGAPDLGAIPFYAKGANTLAF